MKRLSLLLTVLLFSLTAYSQTHKYNFFYSLNEKTTGPALVSQCTTGTYKWEWLTVGVGRVAFQFPKFCGLIYNDSTTSFLAGGSYTIEIYFKFDTTTGYKKIIDFNNLTTDKGFYSHMGKLNLYPNFTSVDSYIFDGKWQYVALTRDETSKKMYLYHNNKVAGTYTDNVGDYKYGVNKRLVFFKDDASGGENGSGAVALIHITNSAMDSNTIKTNYTNIKTTMNVEGVELEKTKYIYPNPVTDYLSVDIPARCQISITDITGKILINTVFEAGENKINFEPYSSGMYLLKITNDSGELSKTIKIVKQ